MFWKMPEQKFVANWPFAFLLERLRDLVQCNRNTTTQGDQKEPSDLRPISCRIYVYSFFPSVSLQGNLLTDFIHTSKESQAGEETTIRKEYSATDHLYTINQQMEEKKNYIHNIPVIDYSLLHYSIRSLTQQLTNIPQSFWTVSLKTPQL